MYLTLRNDGGKLAAWLAGVSVILIGFAATGTGADTFDGLKNAYEKDIRQMDDADKTGNPALDNQYLKALDDLVKKSMSAGDLDTTVAGQKEQKRFQQENSIPKESPTDLPEGIVSLQNKYREALKTQTIEKEQKQEVLTEQYVAKLKSLVKRLTMDNRIEEATSVNEEIKKIEFVLADLTSRLSAENPAVPVVQPAKSPTTNASSSISSLALTIPTNGLVLHFSFDKNEGNTVTDQSGKNNNGTVNGAKWLEKGKHGGAYEFDGVKDNISVPNSASLKLKSVTIMAWIYATDINGDNGAMIMEKRPHDGCWELMHFDEGRMLLRGGSAEAIMTGRHHIKEGEWMHVAGTIHGKKGTLYLNGKAVQHGTVAPVLPTSGEVLIGMGRNWHPSDNFFKGMIDDVMIYDHALTDVEIKTIYDAQKK